METSQELNRAFQELKQRRKNGELSEKEYYSELLKLAKRVIDTLEEENISCDDVKKQIPLIALFISDQIDKLSKRED